MGACMSTEHPTYVSGSQKSKVIFWQHAVWNLTSKELLVSVYDPSTEQLELEPPVNILPAWCVMLASETRGLVVLQLQQTIDGWQAVHRPEVRLLHLPSSAKRARVSRGAGLQHGSCVAIRDGPRQLLQLYPSECKGPNPPLAGVVWDEGGHIVVTRAVQTSSGFLEFAHNFGPEEAVAVVQQQPVTCSKQGSAASYSYMNWINQLKSNSSGIFKPSTIRSSSSSSLFRSSTSSNTTTAAAVALAAMVAAAAAAVVQTATGGAF